MLAIERSHRFKKDVKLMRKRGKSIAKLKLIIVKLARQEPLLPKHRDHALIGKFRYARECHIEPDWLLIYTLVKDVLRLERTGTHADLFE